MTTPKSPEQVLEKFLTDFPATNDSDSKELSMYQRKAMKEYLRSSMASLLLWAAEQMNEHLAVEPIPELEGADATYLQVGDEVLADCSDFLIEEARKISNE